MRRSGFTIVEFIISITAMLIVMAAVFPIVFNKVQNANIVHTNKTITCGCDGCSVTDNSISIIKSNNNYYKITIPSGTNEFASVKITGGGAGGGDKVGGGAGNSTEIYLPRVEGEYLVHLGTGGSAGSNGQATSFYQVIDGKNELLVAARGGITSKGEEEKYTNRSVQAETSAYSETCGKGGAVNKAGTMGEVIISW